MGVKRRTKIKNDVCVENETTALQKLAAASPHHLTKGKVLAVHYLVLVFEICEWNMGNSNSTSLYYRYIVYIGI